MGAEHVDDGEQVLYELLFWRERIPVHDQQFRSMLRTESRKLLEAEADELVLVRNDEPTDLPQLDLLHEAHPQAKLTTLHG